MLTFANFTTLLGGFDAFHGLLLAVTVAVAVLGVALASLGVPLGVDLALLMLIPWVAVVGYEVRGTGRCAKRWRGPGRR
ncbi:hypothetical protein G7085_09340 [Tessaracoccus sp. HDW20]|uniref:hypothetical protein n=1 Tax=Tessaracoccus coleopterorum TaxID=2714950 RepID=UPI0018D3C67E|nr:hypothetical protein [Tessaracoccus coleopterorum]NHB84742.1 hypothetical protein [Tessaracoccus coleopterorum]